MCVLQIVVYWQVLLTKNFDVFEGEKFGLLQAVTK